MDTYVFWMTCLVVVAIFVGAVLISVAFTIFIDCRENLRTHAEVWREARMRDWIMRDLEPPCATIGHEFNLDPDECDWCGNRVAMRPKPPKAALEEIQHARALRKIRRQKELQERITWASRSRLSPDEIAHIKRTMGYERPVDRHP